MTRGRTGLVLVCMALVMVLPVLGSDPDLTTDFDVNATSGSNFTFSGFRNPVVPAAGSVNVLAANPTEFVGITGLGISSILFTFGPKSQVSPHTHPRATEIFYVLSGTIDVGFVDTKNEKFEGTLQASDLFVFPKGLLHWQRNNYGVPASGFSSFTSENPGLLSVAGACFTSGGSGLPDIVLADAFNTNTATINAIKKGLNVNI